MKEGQVMDDVSEGQVQRQAAKRAAILAAAREVFFAEGYGRASMDRVLGKVGGSKRTLYNYFPSKEDLFAALVTEVSDRVLASLKPPAGRGGIERRLTAIGSGYLNTLLSPDGLALYRAMVSEAPHFPDLAQSFFARGPGRASGALAGVLRDEAEQGRLKIEDPQLAAEQFLALVRGDLHLAAVLGVRKPSKALIERSVAQAVAVFLRGLGGRRSEVL
ncbi:MAG: TetR/AcrR family transcriptional regulator [Rhodospirillales bacterium]